MPVVEGDTFVGIDGGATRATALVTNAAGATLARLEGGPGVVRSTDPAPAVVTLAELVRRALGRAGTAPPAAALCCGLAGVGREPVRIATEEGLAASGVARRVRVVTDAETALHDAFAGAPGILVISGTGSVAWGTAPAGTVARAGGWGALLGDEGSGYALGLAALRAVARAADRRGLATTLTPAILSELRVDAPPALIPWADAATKADIAALAPLVLRLAASDPVASAILSRAAEGLACHVEALLDRLGPWPHRPAVAFAGRLLAPDSPLRAALVTRLAPLDVDVLDRLVDAARGAATLARLAR
jgi:glucosamine kinase